MRSQNDPQVIIDGTPPVRELAVSAPNAL